LARASRRYGLRQGWRDHEKREGGGETRSNREHGGRESCESGGRPNEAMMTSKR
jgi:hypothetical protein